MCTLLIAHPLTSRVDIIREARRTLVGDNEDARLVMANPTEFVWELPHPQFGWDCVEGVTRHRFRIKQDIDCLPGTVKVL